MCKVKFWKCQVFGGGLLTVTSSCPSTKKCLLLLCRVRRSSTWSSPLLPTLHYMRHGAPRPIRVKCSLGTKWRNVTSVLFPREPPCSSLQVCGWPLLFHSDSPCTLNAALIMTQCSDAFKIQAASSCSLEIQRGSLKEHLWKCCWHLRRSLVASKPTTFQTHSFTDHCSSCNQHFSHAFKSWNIHSYRGSCQENTEPHEAPHCQWKIREFSS